jgi:hypothetical protein
MCAYYHEYLSGTCISERLFHVGYLYQEDWPSNVDVPDYHLSIIRSIHLFPIAELYGSTARGCHEVVFHQNQSRNKAHGT